MNQKIKSGKRYTNWHFPATLLVLLFMGFYVPPFAWAGENDIETRLLVSPNTIGEGEPFTVVIEVTSDQEVDVTTPQPPQIEGARFLGQSQGQRINSTTGMNAQGKLEFKSIRTHMYTYQYAAEKVGVLVVPPASISVAGSSRKLNGAHLTVLNASQAQQSRRNRPRGNGPFGDDDSFTGGGFGSDPFENIDRMEEAFNRLLQRQFGGGGVPGFQAVPPINAKDAFVIVAEVDKTTAYKGEQITSTWYLYTKSGVREIDTLKYPTLKGFWKEDIELATLLTFQPAELNGQPYNKALLASYALFPIEAGKATIDPYRAKVSVVTGFGKISTSVKDSQSIPILVKPLPEVPQQAVFSGAVGEFQMTAKMETASVVAHQPFSIKVRIDGRGNAKQFELPNLALPPSVELYDIKKDSQFFKNGTSYKEFEIFLIPREEGDMTIPAIATTVFNPKTEKYETLSTQEFPIHVLAGSGQQTLAADRIHKEVAPQTQELVPLAAWTPSSPQQWTPRIRDFVVLFSLSGGLFVLFGFWASGTFAKEETLLEKFERRFKKLRTVLTQKKWRELGVDATNLVNFVLGDIVGAGGADVHIDRLLEKLPPSVRKEISPDLKPMMNRFFTIGFGPDEALRQMVESNDFSRDLELLKKLMTKAIEMSSLS
ncbi:MAG: protein BatD [Bdellovibrionaceae bacterium]|nr:protein BatD [Pseudobdellovibrionaceae bacterium]